MRCNFSKIIILLGFMFLFQARIIGQTKVKLTIEKNYTLPFSRAIFYVKDFSDFGLTPEENERESKFDEKILIRVKRTDDNSTDFDVWVDSNNNGILDENSQRLKSESFIKVIIDANKLPFMIKHHRSEKNGKIRDNFDWSANFRATGTFKSRNCSLPIYLLDFNGDGFFDKSDTQATNLQIDQNRDKKIWGAEEYRYTNEIIELCGKNYKVKTIDKSGRSITLAQSKVQFAKVGKAAPNFTLFSSAGQKISSELLKDKVFLIDFWASWCVPCIETLPKIKSLVADYGSNLVLISVNVDTKARRNQAEEIIKKNGLEQNAVIRELGNNDDFWRSFGSSKNNRLAIPLYVLVDKKGVVQYLGNGGEDLSELMKKVTEIINQKTTML
jgi:thiol-disulfide isomerase/thioredoxin